MPKRVETRHLNSAAHIWWIIFHLDVQLTTRTAFDAHVDSDQEREERLNYLDQYSCRPPPFFLLALSFAQVIIIQIVLLMISISLMMNRYNLALPVNATPPIPDWSVCLPRVDTNQRWEKCRSQWPCIYKGRNFLLAWSNLFYRIRSLFLCQLSEIMPVFRIKHRILFRRAPWSSIQERKKRFGDFSPTSLFTVDTSTSALTFWCRYGCHCTRTKTLHVSFFVIRSPSYFMRWD